MLGSDQESELVYASLLPAKESNLVVDPLPSPLAAAGGNQIGPLHHHHRTMDDSPRTDFPHTIPLLHGMLADEGTAVQDV